MKKQKLLIVDDEEMNVDILQEYLESEGYETVTAVDGQDAWEKLEKTRDFSVILLDRMMPKMDGMEFMARLNRNKRYREIPVIMQTAASSSQEILEGLRAGVFYYLTKPFDRNIIISVVRAALENTRTQLKNEAETISPEEAGLELMTRCDFTFRTMEEAERACQFAARLFPDPARVLIGLSELAYNAIEHGNLGITYSEKNQLILEGRLKSEIKARLANPTYRDRRATMTVIREADRTKAILTDMGSGFNYLPFLDLDPLKVTKLNGRGIAIARIMSFDHMEFNESGNQITCSCNILPEEQINLQNQAPAA